MGKQNLQPELHTQASESVRCTVNNLFNLGHTKKTVSLCFLQITCFRGSKELIKANCLKSIKEKFIKRRIMTIIHTYDL